jgi:Zn-dependent protease with chaperone function
MNFFEQQAAARRASTWLMLLFALAVLCIVLVIGGLAWMVFPSWRMLAFCTGMTLIVIGFGSLFRIASLSEGGAVIAQQLGGTLVPGDTQDPALRRLRHVVEEMAIASGVPVPKLYVMDDEPGINAFAAGFTASDAAVAVTRGALDRLNRDELQGVIAHEFSHILNGDMRLNIRLIGVLFGILMIGLIGRKIFQYGRWGGRNDKGNGLLIVLALVAVVIGWLGQFFARLIKAGISRSRERLADASAVQFTRQTQGLAGALKKIAGLEGGSRLNHRDDAEEVSHMLFGDGVGFSRWFATHPPLLERIQALEPGFRNEQLQRLATTWRAQPPDGMQEDVALGLVNGHETVLPDADQLLEVSPVHVAAQVATPADNDFVQADLIVTALPDALRDLARERAHVIPLVLALLLERDDDAILQTQQQVIERQLGGETAAQAVRIHQQLVADLHPQLRLPLAALAFPVLRLRPRPQLETFMAVMQAVVDADGKVSLFEYCLGKLLAVHVRESLNPSRYARFGRRKAINVRQEFALLLSVVAQYGNADMAQAKRAYLAGLRRVLPQDHLPYQPPVQGVRALDTVWEPLDALDPLAKQLMVEAVTDAISSDGKVTVAEAELLRMICGVLHCPLPAMLSESLTASRHVSNPPPVRRS